MLRQSSLILPIVAAIVFGCAQSSPDATAQSTTEHLANVPVRANAEARRSPNAIVGQTIGTTEVIVTYGRPFVRGRDIFGDLVKNGEVWRTGANEATTITFSGDVTVGGQALVAGTYGLFTIPSADGWTFIFNNAAEQWGAFNYSADEDALRVQATVNEAPSAEMLTIGFENVSDGSGTLFVHWATVKASVPVVAGG